MSKKYTLDEINELIKNKPFTIIDESYSSIREGILAVTNDGYKVILRWNHIFKDQQPEIFHKCNPYTIDNIKQYIVNNNIDVVLLSTEYICNSQDLLWQCSCGDTFECCWNTFLQGKHICNKCALIQSGLNRRIKIEEINFHLNKVGLQLLDTKFEDSITSSKINAIDKDGYKYDFLWCDLKQDKFPEKFHSSNKYTIENINRFLQLERNNEYICISKSYKRNTQLLQFKHKECGHIFKASLIEMQGRQIGNTKDKYYKICPKCNTNKIESNHASILKQVFMHEYPDTTLEDQSCINPKTDRCLPTDIVNHCLKIAIEIQSAYHDSEERKIIDKYKKHFWKNKGYAFYDPDIRNYSILKLIQLFFPYIKEIPNYIDYNFSNCADANKVQDLLDKGFSLKEISNIENIKYTTLNGMLNQKRIILPVDYKEKILHRKPIVRLTKNGDFIKRYENLSSIKEDGFASGTVVRVLKNKQDFSYDSYWIYEDNYISGNYTIPSEKEDHYKLPVDKYDMNNKYITSYDTIYDAEKDSKSSRAEIYRVATGGHKSSRNEKWKFRSITE